MRQTNVVLIVGITAVFLFLNIYALLEILRILRDKQLQRSRHRVHDFTKNDEANETHIAKGTSLEMIKNFRTKVIIGSSSTTSGKTTFSIGSKTTHKLPVYDGTTKERHHHRHHHTLAHAEYHFMVPVPDTSTSQPRIHMTTHSLASDLTTKHQRIDVHRPLPTQVPHIVNINKEKAIYDVTTMGRLPFTSTSTMTSEESDDFTIVTALIDIGRGEWDRYRRPLEQYHLFMENLLSLQNNMIIFTDTSSYDFIHKYRKNMGEMHHTKIHLITLDDLPLSRHLDVVSKLIEDEHRDEQSWHSIWDPAMKDHPEAKSAKYDVLVNSKTYFLYNATLEDPFSTEFFVWIDAGYGHGNQSVFPYNNKWKPRFPRNKISLIKLTPIHDPITRYTIHHLYRQNLSVVSGGFIAGDKRSIGQLHTLVHRKFVELTYYKKVDDDQTVLVLVINVYPQLFNIAHGNWFDAFHLFGTDKSQYGR